MSFAGSPFEVTGEIDSAAAHWRQVMDYLWVTGGLAPPEPWSTSYFAVIQTTATGGLAPPEPWSAAIEMGLVPAIRGRRQPRTIAPVTQGHRWREGSGQRCS
jgi:hypothetical protein